MGNVKISLVLAFGAATLAACGNPHPPPRTNFGAHPVLPAPDPQTIPVMSVNSVQAWGPNEAPKAPAGFTVTRFAANLQHPRWIYVLPNGDVLVAEAAPPPTPSVLM